MLSALLRSLQNVTWRTIVRTILVMSISLLLSYGFIELTTICTNSIMARNERFNNMVKVIDEDTLNYCINSQVDEFLIRGTAKADNPVTLEELTGEYSYIRRTKYHYESHTETYTVTVSDGNGKSHIETKTRIVWDWENKGSDKWSTNTVTLLNKTFTFNNTSHSSRTIRYKDYAAKETSTWKDNHYYYTDDNTRYEYEVIPLEYTTAFISDYNLNMKQGFLSREIEDIIKPQSIVGIRIFFFILSIASLIAGIVFLIFWEEWFPNFLSD